MSRPHPALIELAAGRDFPTPPDPWALVRSAREHRMAGLLWSSEASRVGHSPASWQAQLRGDDLLALARARRMWAGLDEVVRRLDAIGVEVVTVKGITTEARWYARMGERPCDDLDVVVRPSDLRRAGEIARALQPDHPLCARLPGLVSAGRLPAITLAVQSVPVDLHFDLMQLGIPLRSATRTWERTLPFRLPEGGVIRVLDPETALVHLLLNLNKDSFRHLLGFADIARLLRQEQLDWRVIEEMVTAEGLETAVYQSLRAVCTTLGIGLPEAVATPPRGPRARLWSLLWRPTVRLQGACGYSRFRHRQHLLSVVARGRFKDALRLVRRLLFPHPALVRYAFPDEAGSWLWHLTAGRGRHLWQRRMGSVTQRAAGGCPVRPPESAEEVRGRTVDASFVPLIRPTVSSIELDGEAVLFDEATGALCVLGAVATVAWSCFDGSSAVAEVAADLAVEFGADVEQVQAGVIALASRLAGQGMLEP